MNTEAVTDPPALEYDVKGLHLRYDGWRDEIKGSIWDEHSNRKEMRWYSFTCLWKEGKGRIVDFSIRAKHLHPDHFKKGTAVDNRRDVKARALDRAEKWRRLKLKEQESLRELLDGDTALKFEITPDFSGFCTVQFVASFIQGWLVYEPDKCGQYCRTGWLEVVPVGHFEADIARFIADLYFRNGPFEEAVKAARDGLSLAVLRDRFGSSI